MTTFQPTSKNWQLSSISTPAYLTQVVQKKHQNGCVTFDVKLCSIHRESRSETYSYQAQPENRSSPNFNISGSLVGIDAGLIYKAGRYEMNFIGLFLEGFFWGIYSGIFTVYLQCYGRNGKTHNVIFYSICALYVLSIALFISDISSPILVLLGKPIDSLWLHIAFIQSTLFGCCDFIAQFILIYRCWIVWGRNIRVVVIPSISTFAFLATFLASNDSEYILSDQLVNPAWADPVFFSSIALSLTVNALVTGLIVFRIFKVFREVKATLDDQILGTTGGSRLRSIILILIESGMALFSIQLARLVVTIVWTDDAKRDYEIIVTIHQMLNGIAPTIILVRTSMGLSFDDEKSMEAFAIESLRFTSNDPNSVPGTGSIGIIDQDRRDEDVYGYALR